MTQTGDNTARLEEYKTLRDETMRRIDARNQIISYTLAFTAAIFTVALGTSGFSVALLVYPMVAFFFSTAFAYNSLMLIEIGSYLRGLETKIEGLAWAGHLRPVYAPIELFELVASGGLFIGTEVIALFLYYDLDAAKQTGSKLTVALCLICILGTAWTVFYPWLHSRKVARAAGQAGNASRAGDASQVDQASKDDPASQADRGDQAH